MYSSDFTALSVTLARDGKNLAPKRPILDAIENGKPSKNLSAFHKAVQQKYTEKLNYQKTAWNEIITLGQLTSMFINGQQIGLERRPFSPGYYVRPTINDDYAYRQTAMNLMRFYYQCCETKMISANPNVTIRPGGDSPLDIASAQAARPVVDYWESQWYTAKFNRRESLYAATNGLYIHRVRWNPFKGKHEAQSREIGQQQVQLDEGTGECYDCHFNGKGNLFPESEYGDNCPECGSSAVDVQRSQPMQMSQIGHGQTSPVGEPEILQCPLPGWRWDLRCDLEDSSWAIYRQKISQGAVKLIIGDAILPDSQSSDDRSLDVLQTNAYAGQAFGGSSQAAWGDKRENDNRPTAAEFWMSPEDYADIEIDETETVSGITIPKGKMREHFHEPMCFVGLNDMALMIGVYANETQRNQVVTGQWFMESDSGAGRGMQDTASVQKRFNAIDGQVYQGLAATATPATLTDLRLLKEEQSGYLGKPNTTLDVNLSMLPPGLGLKDAVLQLTPGSVNQQYIQYGSVFLRDMFQLSAMVTEFTQGLIGVDNRTATGAQITAALANSLFGPMLLTKGQTRVRIAEMIVCLEGKYGKVQRYFPGKANARGRMVSGKDVQGKIIYELEENSELPTTPFSRQTDIRVLIEAMGGIQGLLVLKTQDPAMFRSLIRPFNVKVEAEDSDVISTICLERMQQAEDLVKSGLTDPDQIVAEVYPPISPIEPKLQEKAEWFANWLDLDTSRQAPMVLRQVAENFYWAHVNAEAQKQIPQGVTQGLTQGVAMAAAQAPAAIGQSMLQPEEPQDTSMEDSERQRELDDVHHAEDLEEQRRLKEIESRTQIEVTKLQGQNQLEAAKIAAKNRAKPKAKAAA